MLDFEALCKKIIDTNGNPSVDDILSCGYSMEHFIRLSQPDVNTEKLVKNARRELLDRGIHYKEN